MLVAALTFVAVYRFRDTQSLIVLAKSIPNNAGHIQWGKPCWPVRDVDTYRISRWIGEDAELALLHRPIGLLVQQDSVSDETLLRLLRESSGLTEITVNNRDLPASVLPLIVTRHSPESLSIRLPVISASDAKWLSQLKSLKEVRFSQFPDKPRENDWSWLKKLPRLASLDVSLWGTNDRDLIALAECNSSVELYLKGTVLAEADPMDFPSDRAFEKLCGLPNLKDLTIDDAHVQLHFSPGSKLPSSLERLELRGAMFDDRSLASIADLPRLYRVTISGGQVSDEGLRVLVNLPSLREIALDRLPNVTDAGMEVLASARNLRQIWVSSLGTTACGLVHIMHGPAWTELIFDGADFHRQDKGHCWIPRFEEAQDHLERTRETQRRMREIMWPNPGNVHLPEWNMDE